MRDQPEQELRHLMASCELYPDTIEWDGRIHRFPGVRKQKGKSGWYIAFADRDGAMFGDWASGLKEHWKIERDEPVSQETRAWWQKDNKAKAENRSAQRQEVAERVKVLWAEGSKAGVAKHPYVKAKKLKAPSAKVREGTLLIPMRNDNGEIVNLQRISPSGQKRFMRGAEVTGSRLTIGGHHFSTTNSRMFLCEGWATGCTIAKATNCAVVVAFTAGGLRPVGKALRKRYPHANIVIAADNDRWSSIFFRGEKVANPGVVHAKAVAEEISADISIPDFKDLSGKPTDFNDLFVRQGVLAVKTWLKPGMADKAVTTPPTEETETRKVPEAELPWMDTAPFRCLGVHEGTYFFLPEATGQIVALNGSTLSNKAYLFQLQDELSWWANYFPGPSDARPVDWMRATIALMKVSHDKGLFQPSRMHGRGMWRDETNNVIFHLGDRLLPPGTDEYVRPESFQLEGRFFPRAFRHPEPNTPNTPSP